MTTTSPLSIRLVLSADTLAYCEENGVERTDVLASVEAELAAMWPEARITVEESLGGHVSVARYAADGSLDYEPGDEDVERDVQDVVNRVTERLIEDAPADG